MTSTTSDEHDRTFSNEQTLPGVWNIWQKFTHFSKVCLHQSATHSEPFCLTSSSTCMRLQGWDFFFLLNKTSFTSNYPVCRYNSYDGLSHSCRLPKYINKCCRTRLALWNPAAFGIPSDKGNKFILDFSVSQPQINQDTPWWYFHYQWNIICFFHFWQKNIEIRIQRE